MATMKALRVKANAPNGGRKPATSLELATVPKPELEAPTDVLIRVHACAVNPVDTKIRRQKFPASEITGYDGAGVIEEVGTEAKSAYGFAVGDEVFWMSQLDPDRPGATAQFQVVDAQLVARKPKSFDWADAAAVPLVALTAWEMLVERFNLVPDDPEGLQARRSILVINGAGGVGSMAIQLARHVFKLGTVIATASRDATIAHCKEMGATHVISHHVPLQYQIQGQGDPAPRGVDYVFICYDTNKYMVEAVDLAAPCARIGSIVEVDSETPLDGLHDMTAFVKQITFCWEMVLSKGTMRYEMHTQGQALKKIAELCDQGIIKSPRTQTRTLSLKELVRAHEELEGGKVIGKIALEVGDDIE